MNEDAPGRWYARTVWGVGDIERSVAFYVGHLGFTENWRHGEEAGPLIVQVGRGEFELILSTQWPKRVGHGVAYVELTSDLLDATRAEFEAKGVAVKDSWWGNRLMVVEDPDGNALWFPYADDAEPKS